MKIIHRPQPKKRELIQGSPLTNAALSEIAACSAELYRLLNSDFRASCGDLLTRLERSVSSLQRSSQPGSTTFGNLATLLAELSARLETMTVQLPVLEGKLAESSQTCKALMAKLETSLLSWTAMQERCAKAEESNRQSLETIADFRLRIVAMERTVELQARRSAQMEKQYRTLCSELRRLNDSGS
jgi:chromosome segregation ATPase